MLLWLKPCRVGGKCSKEAGGIGREACFSGHEKADVTRCFRSRKGSCVSLESIMNNLRRRIVACSVARGRI